MDSVSTPPTPSSQVTPAQDDLAAQIAAPAPPDVPHVSQAELDRRAQSDRASTAISEKMLQGWKLLSQECPNPECHGIPLMHPPKPRPEMDAADIMLNGPESGRINTSTTTSRKRSKHAKAAPLSDPRMLCVACGSRYLQESDVPAFDAYQAQQQQPQATVTTQQPEPQAQHSSMAGMAPTAMAGPPLQRRGEAPAQKPTLSPFVPEDTMTTAMRSTALPALPSVALPSINAPPASGPSDLSHVRQSFMRAVTSSSSS